LVESIIDCQLYYQGLAEPCGDTLDKKFSPVSRLTLATETRKLFHPLPLTLASLGIITAIAIAVMMPQFPHSQPLPFSSMPSLSAAYHLIQLNAARASQHGILYFYLLRCSNAETFKHLNV
jgi:hypothetical protein